MGHLWSFLPVCLQTSWPLILNTMFLQWLSSSQLYCCYFAYKPTLKTKEEESYCSMMQFDLSKSTQWLGRQKGSETVRLISVQFSWHFHMWLNQSSLSSVPAWEIRRVLHLFNHVRACWIRLKSYRNRVLVGCRNGLLAVYITVWCNNNTHEIYLNLCQGSFLL